MQFWQEVVLQRAKNRLATFIGDAERRPYVVYYNVGYRWAKRSSFKIRNNAIKKAVKLRLSGAEVWLRVYDPVTQTWSSWNDQVRS